MSDYPPNAVLGLAETLRRSEQSPCAALDFADVFAEHGAYVLCLLERLGVHAADVEDVAQEVFLTVHKKLPSFEGRSCLKTWICGICLRKALAYRRVRARHGARFGASLTVEPSVSGGAEEQLVESQRARLLQRALDELSAEQRAVFVLYEIEQLAMQEIAGALGCPRFTAYTRLRAARRQMQAFFTRARVRGDLP